jgi:hypothetical protein
VHPAQVETGEHEHVGPGGRQAGQPGVEAGGEVVDVALQPDQVVAARAERHEVGTDPLDDGHLVVDDLVEELPADGEVGVAEVGRPGRELLGHAVRPARGASRPRASRRDPR